jgi:hypothetical protein
MPRDKLDVSAALLRKGFSDRNGDHRFFCLMVDGLKTQVTTKISHGGKEIADNMLGVMARQAHLTGREFRDLIDCPLSEDEYLALLRDRDAIP